MILNNFEPLPKDLKGWNGEHPIFEDLVTKIKPEVIVEVGTWKGQSAITMAKACKKVGIDTKIYCIDTWLGSLEFQENERQYGKDWDRMLLHGYPQIYYQFISNCVHEGVIDMIFPIASTSRDAAPYAPLADLIYIDGDHTYRGVKEDIEAYYPKLKERGVIFGDDYTLRLGNPREADGYLPGVKEAIDEYVFSKGIQHNLKIVDNNFWLINKNML